MSKKELMVKSLGELICRIRKERRLSQDDLAKMANISQMTIQRLEASEVGIRLDNLIAIAGALDMSLTDLFKEIEGTKNRKKAGYESRWHRITTKADELTGVERDWLAGILEEALKSPWGKKAVQKD